MLSLMYFSGLRISEVVNLKAEDSNFENKLLRVQRGKSRKDRNTILSEKVADVLKKYTKNKNIGKYVFESQ